MWWNILETFYGQMFFLNLIALVKLKTFGPNYNSTWTLNTFFCIHGLLLVFQLDLDFSFSCPPNFLNFIVSFKTIAWGIISFRKPCSSISKLYGKHDMLEEQILEKCYVFTQVNAMSMHNLFLHSNCYCFVYFGRKLCLIWRLVVGWRILLMMYHILEWCVNWIL